MFVLLYGVQGDASILDNVYSTIEAANKAAMGYENVGYFVIVYSLNTVVYETTTEGES